MMANITPADLAADLRSRINPDYATTRGTESYERRLCAEALEAQTDETIKLRAEIFRLLTREQVLMEEAGIAYDKLENLEVQAVRDVVDGWVCIPAVEWDSIMTHNVEVQGREAALAPRSVPLERPVGRKEE